MAYNTCDNHLPEGIKTPVSFLMTSDLNRSCARRQDHHSARMINDTDTLIVHTEFARKPCLARRRGVIAQWTTQGVLAQLWNVAGGPLGTKLCISQ
jgi:hypothetical protein